MSTVIMMTLNYLHYLFNHLHEGEMSEFSLGHYIFSLDFKDMSI